MDTDIATAAANGDARPTNSTGFALQAPAASRLWATGETSASPPPSAPLPSGPSFWQAVDAGDDVALNKLCNRYLIEDALGALREQLTGRRDGRTMVMAAAERGHVRVCRTLIKNGADATVGQERGGLQQRRGETERLSTPMALAAQHGHYAVVELLLRLSFPHHDALDSCYLDIHSQPQFAEILHVLSRGQRVSEADWIKLLHYWVQRPDSTQAVQTILFATRVKPNARSMLLAAQALQPLNVRLLRDYGARGDAVVYEAHIDSSSYHANKSRQMLLKKTPLRAALDAYTQDKQVDVLHTVTELCLAGAKFAADDMQTAIESKDTPLLRYALRFCEALQTRHVLTAAANGSLAILARLLDGQTWTDKDIEAAAVRAQDNALPQTVSLLRAYQTMQRLRRRHTGGWSWPIAKAWWPGAASAACPDKPSRDELAATVELQEAEAHLALQLRLAAEVNQERFDASLPVPGVSALGPTTVVLYRG